MTVLARLHRLILRMSLRTKIMFAMMIVSIGVTTGVAQFAFWRIERIILDNVESTGKFMVSSLSDHIAGLLLQSQYFEIREILAGIQLKDDRILFIVVKDLTTPDKVDVAQVGESKWIHGTEGIFGDRIVSVEDSELYVFFKTVEIRGVENLLGVVRIGLSLDYMKSRLTETRDFVLAIMAIAICFSLVLAFVISNAVLIPMRSLMAGILKIAGGQFSHRINVHSQDETGVLANSFNRMTENLTTLQDISAVLNESDDPAEVLNAALGRLSQNISAKSGSVVFHGSDGEELAAGDPDETSLFYLRKLRSSQTSRPSGEGRDHPDPIVEESRLCFPFYSEGEITGGIWMVRPSGESFDEIDERLLQGVSEQLESTLSKIEFQYRAVTDAMTGLYNHRYFQQELTRQIERSERLGRKFSLAMADIDHFKPINDSYGHQQGDIVLRAVGDAIKRSIRGKVDVPCRYGGEEFAIILPDTSIEGAKIFAERFRTAVEEFRFDFNGTSVRCTISIGLATYPEAAHTKRELIEAADRALYAAKESGRNAVRTYKDI